MKNKKSPRGKTIKTTTVKRFITITGDKQKAAAKMSPKGKKKMKTESMLEKLPLLQLPNLRLQQRPKVK